MHYRNVPAAKTRIDASPVTALPLCDCGWRGPVFRHRAKAQAAVDEHRRDAHPDTADATEAMRRSRA